jgi:hypothetical protein
MFPYSIDKQDMFVFDSFLFLALFTLLNSKDEILLRNKSFMFFKVTVLSSPTSRRVKNFALVGISAFLLTNLTRRCPPEDLLELIDHSDQGLVKIFEISGAKFFLSISNFSPLI